MTTQDRLDYLAQNGIVTSVCYGPCGDNGSMFTVNVLNQDFESFAKPYGAKSYDHATEIAYIECVGRGWIPAYEPAE